MKKERILVKAGSNVLSAKDGTLDSRVVARIAGEICGLREKTGHEFVIVTSGAVNTGRSLIGRKKLCGSETIVKQTLAAIGQPLLIAGYAKAFGKCGVICGQILLTSNDFANADGCASLVDVITTMLESGIVPVVNENDATSSEELQNAFTDNDQLSALLAIEIEADKLIILSDVDGFMDGPLNDPASRVVPVIRKIEDYLLLIDPNAGNGRGGMRSKLETAKKVTEEGIEMYIGNGTKERTLTGILEGEPIGTRFPAKNRR